MPAHPLMVESLRAELVESTHQVTVAVVDRDGRRIAYCGDPELSTFIRSAAKPFQALPLLEDGAAQHFNVSAEELALACASHNSEPDQVRRVSAFMERLGLSEADLACGPHRPLSLDLAITDEVALQAAPRTPLASNCSGKHTAMLAVALHRGWPTRGYHEAGHPVQRRCKESVAQWAGMRPDEIGEAVDGCGVVTFALPVDALATAYARLGVSDEAAPRAITAAMMGHPDLVAGRGRSCTALMQAYPSQVIAKIGAAGVYGAALPRRGIGIGLKVHDGHNWASVAALIEVLTQLGLEPAPSSTLAQFADLPLRNTRGEPVGRLRTRGRLTFV